MNYKDKYQKRLNSFHTFDITEEKFKKVSGQTKRISARNFRIGFIVGLLFETLIVATPIYENTVRKATMRRLENKLIDEANLREREAKLLEKENATK